jgi:hypothetical protein
VPQGCYRRTEGVSEWEPFGILRCRWLKSVDDNQPPAEPNQCEGDSSLMAIMPLAEGIA